MYVIDYVIYGLWVLFWLAWLAAALTAKRAAQSRMRQFVGLRVALFVILIVRSRHRRWPCGSREAVVPVAQRRDNDLRSVMAE